MIHEYTPHAWSWLLFLKLCGAVFGMAGIVAYCAAWWAQWQDAEPPCTPQELGAETFTEFWK